MLEASIQIPQFPDGRLDTKHAAAYLGLSVKTLAIKRSNGTGPKFVKRGRVFYYQTDLDDWLKKVVAFPVLVSIE